MAVIAPKISIERFQGVIKQDKTEGYGRVSVEKKDVQLKQGSRFRLVRWIRDKSFGLSAQSRARNQTTVEAFRGALAKQYGIKNVQGTDSYKELEALGQSGKPLRVRHIKTALAQANKAQLSKRWKGELFWKTATPSDVRAGLAAGVDPNVPNQAGWTPLHLAATGNQDPAIIAELTNAGANPNLRSTSGKTPLHLAATHNNPACIIALTNAGAELGARDSSGSTPLHQAAKGNQNPESMTTLLNAGANMEAKNLQGWTPLHLAVTENKNPESMTTLLKAGANIEAKDALGRTPLHLAATFNDNFEKIDTLLNAGANPKAKSKSGETALSYAQSNETLRGTEGFQRFQQGHL